MKKLVLALVALSAMVFAEDTTKTDKVTLTPVIKSEMIMTSALEEGARPVIIFGDNDFGVILNKGDVEVAGVVSLVDYPDYGVALNKVYLKKGIGENFDIIAGYKDIPFGHWTSNCVNFPLVRTGNYDPAFEAYTIKQKATQVEVGFDNGKIVADVAGYMGSDFTSTSLAAKVAADFTIIAPNLSVRADNMDTVDLAVGADIDLGVVGIYGVYSRGLNVDRMGSYFEVSVFPTDFLITAVRADLLANTETKDGLTSFSLSNLFLITDNVYAGLEYTLQSEVIDTELQTPAHLMTALVGFQF